MRKTDRPVTRASAPTLPRLSSRGQSLVEFVLVVPILFLLLAAAVDLGRLFYAYVAVENAAKEGALFGARSPLCDTPANSGCDNPNNVVWHVENEATNLVDTSGNSLMATTVACRRPNGTLVQPINDCLDGDTYQVSVSTPFSLITPILSTVIGSPITLTKQSQATVITDAFDPSGLEVLVFVSTTNATNASAIATACTQPDPGNATNHYFQPCQDSLNVDNYLSFPEGAAVTYKVRVKNTGNVPLSNIAYTFTQGGTTFAKPAACNNLPANLGIASLPVYCTFTRPATVIDPTAGANDDLVVIETSAQSAGVSTGVNNGGSTIKVEPAPRLAINLKAAPYRMGTPTGTAGKPVYPTGNLTLRQDTASSFTEVSQPTGWFYLTVVNNGGAANNFAVTVTRAGSAVTLPASCTVPASLAAAGQTGDRFECIIPQKFVATQAFAFAASASATNAIILGGQQPNVDAHDRRRAAVPTRWSRTSSIRSRPRPTARTRPSGRRRRPGRPPASPAP